MTDYNGNRLNRLAYHDIINFRFRKEVPNKETWIIVVARKTARQKGKRGRNRGGELKLKILFN